MSSKSVIEPTPWFTKDVQPVRIGVYKTSKQSVCEIGSAYGYWNGQKWTPYKKYGDYSKCKDFVWKGLTGETYEKYFHVD